MSQATVAKNEKTPNPTSVVKLDAVKKSGVEKQAASKPNPKPVRQPAIRETRLQNPKYYLNRELTWLKFNFRVLDEARNTNNPLLERLKFIAIVSSNIDEFFMKRIGGLKEQVGAGVHAKTDDGRTPQEQIDQSTSMIKDLNAQKQVVFKDVLQELLKKKINIANYDQLTNAQKTSVQKNYYENIFPLVTPLAMDSAHPFPFLSNLSLNLLTTLQLPDEDHTVQARVKIPTDGNTPRFIQIGDSLTFVPLEQVMANNLDLLFPGMEVLSCDIFRVTRNANTERDEEKADDLLAMIETELRDRKFAPTVRLEVEEGISPTHQGMLASELGLNEASDVFAVSGLLGMADLMEIAMLDINELHDPDHHPINNIKLTEEKNIFHTIRDAGSILLLSNVSAYGTN
jgi:polyphosphate kinase